MSPVACFALTKFTHSLSLFFASVRICSGLTNFELLLEHFDYGEITTSQVAN